MTYCTQYWAASKATIHLHWSIRLYIMPAENSILQEAEDAGHDGQHAIEDAEKRLRKSVDTVNHFKLLAVIQCHYCNV